MTIQQMIAAIVFVATAGPLQAQSSEPPLHVDPSLKDCSVEFAPTLSQAAFGRFVREFGSVSAFKQLASPGTLGRGRVSFGIEMLDFTVDEHSAAWNDTFAHPNDHHPLGASHQFPKVKLNVGVTENMDIGVFYTRNSNANYGWVGLDGKYQLLTEDESTPVSLAVRGAYTKTLYVSDMDMHALTADVSVGRKLWRVVTPYVGVGADGVYARETSNAVNLRNETAIAPHFFGGVNVMLWGRVTLGAEYTRGPVASSQAQIAAVLF